MKKIVVLLLTVLPLWSFSQISSAGCTNFENFKTLKDGTFQDKTFEYPIYGYGQNQAQAKYDAKIKVLHAVFYNDQYLNNPLVDSILSEFAGVAVKIPVEVYPTKRKLVKKGTPPWTAYVEMAKINYKLVDYIKEHINNFLNYSYLIDYNPYIRQNGDNVTKELYLSASQKLLDLFTKGQFQFNNIVDNKLIELAKLEPKDPNHTPCQGFKFYKTGQKYLDYITSLTHGNNQSRQVDFVILVDTIKYNDNGDGTYDVFYSVKAVNVNNARIAFTMEVEDKGVSGVSPYAAVKQSLSDNPFKDYTDKFMYEFAKFFANNIKSGMLISFKICNDLIDLRKQTKLENLFLSCRLFDANSFSQAEWFENGKKIGVSYTIRSYVLSRMRVKSTFVQLLFDAGFDNFEVNTFGTDYIVTPKNQ